MLRTGILSLIALFILGSLVAPVKAQDPGNYPIVPTNFNRARQIYRDGQRLGNRKDVFSKVGDSITASEYFLTPIGVGGLRLEGYSNLQPTVDFFMQTSARDHNSFANHSIAAQHGWTSFDVLDPARASPDLCQPGESPLACEYRIVKPAVALIMIGTNDVLTGVDAGAYAENLNQIIRISAEMGVIPVLSTIPQVRANQEVNERSFQFNQIIITTTRKYNIPLWNYWLALRDLPDSGISSDHVHPSVPTTGEAAVFSQDFLVAGYTQRNLTALQVLDALRRNVLK